MADILCALRSAEKCLSKNKISSDIISRWKNIRRSVYNGKTLINQLPVGKIVHLNGHLFGTVVKGTFLIIRDKQVHELSFENNEIIWSDIDVDFYASRYYYDSLLDGDVVLGHFVNKFKIDDDKITLDDEVDENYVLYYKAYVVDENDIQELKDQETESFINDLTSIVNVLEDNNVDVFTKTEDILSDILSEDLSTGYGFMEYDFPPFGRLFGNRLKNF